MKQLFIKLFSSVAAMLCVTAVMAQDAAAGAVEASAKGGIDLNIILLIVALFLLVPIIVLSKTFTAAVNFYAKKRRKNAAGTIGITILCVLLSQVALAQDAAAPVMVKSGGMSVVTMVLLGVILIEILVILFFANLTVKFVKDPAINGEVDTVKGKTWFQGIWEKINNLKPIEDEAALDTGHSYDGIRELNNTLPPWFTVTFIASIIFAIIYLWRYHVAEVAPLQEQEYENEIAKAQKEHDAYLKSSGGGVDENSVKLLTGADVDAGKTLFVTHCAACHKSDGGGVVGPNLTDDYWIHGGGVNDIFKTIKYGYPDKGMQAWKSNFSGTQMAQLASYIKSIHGSNPPGAKEKQGDLYVEKVVAADSTATKVTDTTAKVK